MIVRQEGMEFEGTPEELREYFKGVSKIERGSTPQHYDVLFDEFDYIPEHEPNTTLYGTTRADKQQQDDEVVEHFIRGPKGPWKWTPANDEILRQKYRKLVKTHSHDYDYIDMVIADEIGTTPYAIRKRRSHLGLVKYTSKR